jgi:hypothetical protein
MSKRLDELAGAVRAYEAALELFGWMLDHPGMVLGALLDSAAGRAVVVTDDVPDEPSSSSTTAPGGQLEGDQEGQGEPGP